MGSIKEFHLFAGIGGGIYGGKLLGHRCCGGVEINKFCQSVLRQRQQDGWMDKFDIFEDVKTIDGRQFKGKFDVLCGGFPCQAFSQAAHGKNIAAKNLWPDMFRFVKASCAPVVFGENVTRAAIEMAERDLLNDGYTVKKCKMSCGELGADHARPRYWLLAVKSKKVFNRIAAHESGLPKLRANCWIESPREVKYPTTIEVNAPQFSAVGNAQSPFAAAVAFRVLVNRHLAGADFSVLVSQKELARVFEAQSTWIKGHYGEKCIVHTPTTMCNFHYPSMQKHPVCKNYVKVFGKPNPVDIEYLMGFPIGASSPNALPRNLIEQWNK